MKLKHECKHEDSQKLFKQFLDSLEKDALPFDKFPFFLNVMKPTPLRCILPCRQFFYLHLLCGFMQEHRNPAERSRDFDVIATEAIDLRKLNSVITYC